MASPAWSEARGGTGTDALNVRRRIRNSMYYIYCTIGRYTYVAVIVPPLARVREHEKTTAIQEESTYLFSSPAL